MADPIVVGGTTPALITALGGSVAAILGAIALFGRRKPSDEAVTPPPAVTGFDVNRDREIERRLTATEVRVDEVVSRLDSHDETIALLRALEVTTEAYTRPAKRTSPRKRA